MRQEYYIQAVAVHHALSREYKELIPDSTLRRRMSKILKCGVATGMECLANFGGSVEGIVTGSGFGCLQDSEKFLRTLIDNQEQQLNPTPFIQSTFNTMGAQIALLAKNHSYNVTYSHGGDSFSHALMDAAMLLHEGAAEQVLIGVADEITPTFETLMKRLRADYELPVGEYAFFMVLSAKRNHQTLASVKLYSETSTDKEAEEGWTYRLFPVSYAARFWEGIRQVREDGEEVVRLKIANQKLFNKVEIRC